MNDKWMNMSPLLKNLVWLLNALEIKCELFTWSVRSYNVSGSMTPHNQAPAHSFTYPFTPPPPPLFPWETISWTPLSSKPDFVSGPCECFSLRESETLSPRSLYRWFLLVTLSHFLCPLYLKNKQTQNSYFLIHFSHSLHCPGWQHWPQGGAGALGTWLVQH